MPTDGIDSGSPSSGEETATGIEIIEQAKQRMQGPAMISDPQRRKIYSIMHNLEKAGYLTEETIRRGMHDSYGTEHTSDLTMAQAGDLIDRLEEYERKVKEQEALDGGAA